MHINRNMETSCAGVDELCPYLNEITNMNGMIEADTSNVNRNTVLASPANSTRVTGLIDPFHHGAAVHFTAKVDFGWFSKKTERDFTL